MLDDLLKCRIVMLPYYGLIQQYSFFNKSMTHKIFTFVVIQFIEIKYFPFVKWWKFFDKIFRFSSVLLTKWNILLKKRFNIPLKQKV